MIQAVHFSSLLQASSAPSLEQGKELKFVRHFQRYGLSGKGSEGGGGGGGPLGHPVRASQACYWRASVASETLTGVTQLKIGDVYLYICLDVRMSFCTLTLAFLC